MVDDLYAPLDFDFLIGIFERPLGRLELALVIFLSTLGRLIAFEGSLTLLSQLFLQKFLLVLLQLSHIPSLNVLHAIHNLLAYLLPQLYFAIGLPVGHVVLFDHLAWIICRTYLE